MGHFWQNAWSLSIHVTSEASPAGHVVLRHGESEPNDHCPGPQHVQSAVGSEAPAGAALPLPQFAGSHRAAPFSPEYLPEGHGVQMAACVFLQRHGSSLWQSPPCVWSVHNSCAGLSPSSLPRRLRPMLSLLGALQPFLAA